MPLPDQQLLTAKSCCSGGVNAIWPGRMSTAAVDVLGFLPGPASKTNTGAADLLGGEALAYAVASSVAVVDVSAVVPASNVCFAPSCCPAAQSGKPRACCWLLKTLRAPDVAQVHRMQLACVLYGAHRSAAVTAVSW